MPYCPICGAVVRRGMTYCSECNPKSSYAIVTCNACLGTGIDALGNRCLGCKGKGQVKVINPPHKCKSCNGTGINLYGGPHTLCRGTGWMYGHSL